MAEYLATDYYIKGSNYEELSCPECGVPTPYKHGIPIPHEGHFLYALGNSVEIQPRVKPDRFRVSDYQATGNFATLHCPRCNAVKPYHHGEYVQCGNHALYATGNHLQIIAMTEVKRHWREGIRAKRAKEREHVDIMMRGLTQGHTNISYGLAGLAATQIREDQNGPPIVREDPATVTVRKGGSLIGFLRAIIKG